MTPGDVRHSPPVRPLCNLHFSHSSPEIPVDRWARDFSRCDPFSDNLVFESVGRRGLPIVEYRLVSGKSGRLIDSLALRSPISDSELSHDDYRRFVEALCCSYRVRHIYVSSMIGHAPELMTLDVPVTIVHHDRHPCRELLDPYLQLIAARQVTSVAPSHAVVRAIRRLYPRFRKIPFVVIENGVDPVPDCFGGAEDGRRMRAAVVGDLELNQDLGLLSQSFEALRLVADLYLIGSGELGRFFESRWGVTVVGSRPEEDLTEILRDVSPDMGLLLSALPNSCGYELSELQARGIPPVATGQGGHRERISHGVDGFLSAPDAPSLTTLVARLDARREELRTVALRLRRRHFSTVRQMVCRYYALREELAYELTTSLERHRQLELQP
jgi:glycosyltransferase involved in cell wall biosynthesis